VIFFSVYHIERSPEQRGDDVSIPETSDRLFGICINVAAWLHAIM